MTLTTIVLVPLSSEELRVLGDFHADRGVVGAEDEVLLTSALAKLEDAVEDPAAAMRRLADGTEFGQ